MQSVVFMTSESWVYKYRHKWKKLEESLEVPHIFTYFATSSCRCRFQVTGKVVLLWQSDVWGCHIWKSVYHALCSWHLESLGNYQIQSVNNATVDAHGYVIYYYYIMYQREVLGCSFRLRWAILRSLKMWDEQWCRSHVFCVSWDRILLTFLSRIRRLIGWHI